MLKSPLPLFYGVRKCGLPQNAGFLVFLLLCSLISAQTIHIQGRYVDHLNNSIPDAQVHYVQNDSILNQTVTANDGAFELVIPSLGIGYDENPVAREFRLSQNYPNPWNPTTRFQVSIKEAASVSIYNILGQQVDALRLPGFGEYTIAWGGGSFRRTPVSAGVYFYVLHSGDQTQTRKMTLLDKGDGSRLTIANRIVAEPARQTSKIRTADQITFTRPNTSELTYSLETPGENIDLGLVTGNVGPRFHTPVNDTLLSYGDTLRINLLDHLYNDDKTWLSIRHSPLPIFIDSVFRVIVLSADTTTYVIDAVDSADAALRDSLVFTVRVPWQNSPPTIALPDTLLLWEDQEAGNIMNVLDYSGDVDSDTLTFTLISQQNPGLIAVRINGDSLAIDSLAANGYGTSRIVITVSDGEYAASDSMILVVQPVNDPISFIGNIPDQETAEDSVFTLDLRSEFENADHDDLDYTIENLSHAAQADDHGIITITPDADWNGTVEGLIAEARVRHTDETARSNPFRLSVEPVNDAPIITLNPQISSLDEDSQGERIIASSEVEDVEGDSLTVNLYNSLPDSAFMHLEGNLIVLDSLAKDFNGNVSYGLTANDGLLEVTEQETLIINPRADVTLNIRSLNSPDTPIMDDIVSMFQIGDSTYMAVGSITKQVNPGTYEIWAKNDSTGIYLDSLRADNYISIRTGDGNPLVTPALATRSLGDTSSAVTFGTEDIILDLYKIVNLNNNDEVIMHYIINNWGPEGIDKPSTATPECYIDTTFAAYVEPIPLLVQSAQYIVDTLIVLASEGRYQPIWMGFGAAPPPDPDGETILAFVFDPQYNPPGNSGNLINPNTNLLYFASVYSPPDNGLTGLAGEAMQSFNAAQGDLLGGNEQSYLIEFNNEGQLVPTEFAKLMFRLRDYFNPGDNF